MLKKGLTTLSRTCTKIGIQAIFKAYESNISLMSIENLGLAGIKFDDVLSKELGSLLQKANSLKRLNLSNTGKVSKYKYKIIITNRS